MKGSNTNVVKIILIYLALMLTLTGCSDHLLSDDIPGSDRSDNTEQEGTPISQPDEKQGGFTDSISFCSDLDLQGTNWPKSLSRLDIDLYALALNITGSFEGFSNFRNLTNNFDGQGISLGIFQQNLGQGSLQPLLIEADDTNENMFTQYFDSSQKASLRSMLSRWKSAQLIKPTSRSIASDTLRFNKLDIGGQFLNDSVRVFVKPSNPTNAESVEWAVNNLFENNAKTFKNAWKNNLKAFAGDPRYVSLQVDAGKYLHDRAMAFMKQYDAYELRSYLFFFDLAVQNGGIQKSVRLNYFDYIEKNPNLTENQRLQKLLEFRLKKVFERFRDDVTSRKMTILTGVGTVHQSDRDLPEEYCIQDWTAKVR